MAPLNTQQKLFCYAKARGLNHTDAAKEAGYSEKTAGSQGFDLLKKPEIKALVEKLTAKTLAAAEVSISDVIEQLRAILNVDPLNAYDDDGKLKPLKEWPRELRIALASLEVIEFEDEGKPAKLKKVKFWTKTAASDQLLRKLGAYKDPLADAVANIVDIITAAAKPNDDDGAG